MSNVIAAVSVETIKAKIAEFEKEANVWMNIMERDAERAGMFKWDYIDNLNTDTNVEMKAWLRARNNMSLLESLIK